VLEKLGLAYMVGYKSHGLVLNNGHSAERLLLYRKIIVCMWLDKSVYL